MNLTNELLPGFPVPPVNGTAPVDRPAQWVTSPLRSTRESGDKTKVAIVVDVRV